MQYFFTSTEEHKYWYVPVAEDHSFVEAEEEVVFAFSDLTRARTVCMHYKWPGLLELGPKKWKNFNIQKHARPRIIRKNPVHIRTGLASPNVCEPSNQTKMVLVGLLLLMIMWLTFKDRAGGPILLIIFLVSRLISPVLQFLSSFVYIIYLLFFASLQSCMSAILTWAFAFTALEVYTVFAPPVFVVNIDRINLRDL